MPEQENTQNSEGGEVKLAPILGTSIDANAPIDSNEDDDYANAPEVETLTKEAEAEAEAAEETPPKEEDAPATKEGEDKEVSFADFLKRGEKDSPPEQTPPAQKPPPQETPTIPKGPRDYAGIAEEHVPLFKGMSNESFAALKPLYIEHKELTSKVKQKEQELETLKKASTGQEIIHPSFRSHPQAYMLTKEYGQRLAQARVAENILEHWNTQLVKIRRGEDWKDLQEDSKTGQIYISPEAKTATADDELVVMRRIAEAQQLALEYKTKVSSFAQEHKSAYDRDIAVVREAEKGFFPDYDKPDHPTAKIQKSVIEALPESLRDDPLAQTLAYVTANNAILQAEIQKLKKMGQTNGKPLGTKQPLKGEFSGSVKPRAVTYQDFIAHRD